MNGSTAGRVMYGLLFCVLLPVALAAWACRLDDLLSLPTLPALPAMWGLSAVGIALMAWSMHTLWSDAGGLPMNAFPPPRLTLRGPYAVLAHPIYVGFTLALVGAAAGAGSAAGLLVVAPAVAIGCASLVWGYEAHDLDRRFGADRARAWLRLPAACAAPGRRATHADRWRTVVMLFGWWAIGYEVVGHLSVPDAVELMRGPEARWPVWMWWTTIYSLAYLMPPAAVFAALDGNVLARWSRDCVLGMVVGFVIMLTVPLVATPRGFDTASPLAWLMNLNRSDGVGGRAAFPSFHVFWAFMAAALLWHRGRAIGSAAWVLALLIAVSCITTGMHAVTDAVAGAMLAALALARQRLWSAACATAQCVANSWCQWQIGPVRLLVHGLYAGAASAAGVLLIAAFDPAVKPWRVGFIAIASLVGAGVWGQILVGSRRLQRPYGYFGSVLGVLIAAALLAELGASVWPLLAATAAAAPWIQAIGRLRCLVQGCCHGAPVRGDGGIVYRLPQSRAVAISGLLGARLHPTPLYSIVCNVVLGLIVARLCMIEAPASLVAGAYLFIQGVARFVEESYRGEAQTQHAWGLRIYQWFAVGIAVLGAGMSCIASPAAMQPAWPRGSVAPAAAVVAVLYAFAMGVDFPRCTWRMSRLTPS